MKVKMMTGTLLLPALLLNGCSDGSDQHRPAVPPSSLSIVEVAHPEGAAGEIPQLVFRATLTTTQPEAVLINYETSAITATANEDYLDYAGELEKPAGEMQGYISIDLIGDGDEEPAETFELSYSSSANARPTAPTAIRTIANDDTACDMPFTRDPNPWRVNGADPPDEDYVFRGIATGDTPPRGTQLRIKFLLNPGTGLMGQAQQISFR